MKKVGFVIPSFMYEILVGDMEYFRLKLGELGNKILSYYLGKTILGKLDFKTSSSERVQFNLSKTNEKILEQLKKEKKLEKEGQYFRNMKEIIMAKKGALTGLLLFGIFFGAGNLIFPPSLGALSGEQFLPAIAGFVFSGVGIAVLTLIIGTLNPKGYIHDISKKISPWFATLYLAVLYLSIGPFFAIPRTATTAYEVGINPLLSEANKGLGLIIFTVLYFAAAYLISLNPSKILDRIGRILTPVFALLIVILVVLGAFKYGGTSPQAASDAYQASAFGTGFLEGYNTLDALASVAFSVIAVQTMKQL